ncbi:MAG: hypothetical protein ABJD97_23085 [Betaproteobacteria bacterium]
MPTPSPDDPPPQRPGPDAADVPGSPLRAVLTGLALDIGGSEVLHIVLGIAYALQVTRSGMSEEQMQTALAQWPQSMYAVVGMVLGSLCSVAGGYACARIVQRDEFRSGGVMAAISGFLSIMLSSSAGPDDMTLLFTACTVACNLLGVKFGREHNLRLAQPAAPPADSPLP